ncbi:basement membrane-specific heparan sulfate proteoglycan core protein-like isoform X4 [Aphidius gifuensis]|uniref:basement membrane-specific heparan sulfate proteoglycan core protein-like isoform X4 n=1 Tax=Aphidius gifuensis TaxID=684658 RepID=UPI001CDD432B|nr:basement membrane-specific heparan sulfate proteoglycan core protein-like isoform X4 [Aphidius gifuensis]
MVIIKSAIAVFLVLQVLGHWHQVDGYENDDLVFDIETKSPVEIKLIDKHEEGLFHRIKRDIGGWFSWFPKPSTTTVPPTETTTTTTTTTTTSTTSTSTTTPLPEAQLLQSSTSSLNRRPTRNSDEVIDEQNSVGGNEDEDNAIGEVGEKGSNQEPIDQEDEDNEGWPGSGDTDDGSGTTGPDIFNPPIKPSGGQSKFYRVTLTISEPYLETYADIHSPQYTEFTKKLNKSIVKLLFERIPNYDHLSNVVKISPTNDPFKLQVTLDIGSTFTDENEIRDVLKNQLSLHSLGDVEVSPEGFTFRISQEKCDEHLELRCRDGTCVPLISRCDGKTQCPDKSDELDCSTTIQPTEETTTERVKTEKSFNEIPGLVPDNFPTPVSSTNDCRGDDAIPCSDGSRIICSVQQCDGVYDCRNGEDEKNCSNSCGYGEFACDASRCILDKQKCDFIQDCEDGSDERGCNYPACNQNEFRCRDHQCIDIRQRCDGINDCHDKSDELSCPRCHSYEFDCGDGRCINESSRCNGYSDCQNGSDEWNCTVTTCNSDQFRCPEGTCLPIEKRCDRHSDCRNGEDELQCGVAPCPSMDFTCGDGSCIPTKAVCDGYDDCPSAEDELKCDRDCTPTQFKCISDGRCIEDVYRCDRRSDCDDRSDEDNCSNVTSTINSGSHTNVPGHNWVTERPRECNPNTEMRCGNGKCILLRLKCDNIPDCDDNSDERDCGNCAIDEWRCADGECVSKNFRCDGRSDCRDGSDEEACDSQYCSPGQLPCANGVCISKDFFCDRNRDCHDGSDEENCPGITPYPASTQCRGDEYTCRDKSCIPLSSVCDNRQDCSGNEDELDCKRGCARGQFRCGNGDCISGDKKCDKFYDCEDGSDEENCGIETTTSAGRHCSYGQFQCESDKICVLDSARCNGIPECRDGSDEYGCAGKEKTGLDLKTYPSEQNIKENPVRQGREVVFQCRDESDHRARVRWSRGNNLPLPPGSVDKGDGRLEIPNIKLEHSGPYICEAVGYPSSFSGQKVTVNLHVENYELPVTRPPQVCKYDEATCSNGDCIPKTYVCDGKFDCTDGSDEMRCNPHGCEPNQYRCANKQCVSKIWRCDGDKDCNDGSDEENCEASPPGSLCRYDEFQCTKYDQCIPKSYHCDMERDCQDGSDEFGCSPVYIVKPPQPIVVLASGETMILTCTAIGVPIPEINWRLNWGHVPSKCDSVSVNGTGSLTCPDISISDQGAYSCEALNIGGFVFAVPDAILIVNETQNVCQRGEFNSEAKKPDECISCFCFGVTNQCRSADLFTFQLPPPFDRHKVLDVDLTNGEPQIRGEIGSKVAEIRPINRDGVEISMINDNYTPSSFDIPYFALPEAYHGSQLNSYGGYLKYTIRYSGDGRNNTAPAVILSGNRYMLFHRGHYTPPNQETEEVVRFFYGEWYKIYRGREITATRQDIMMALANVDNILIKAKYDDSPQLDISITEITMDSAEKTNVGLGSASFVEECSCPAGYTGLSCESCASGHERKTSGPWLGECQRAEPIASCPPGYYGDPSRNIPCEPCPCPLTNPSNQFARTCQLGPNREPVCDCPPGYMGSRCESCSSGYRGNPLIPGDMCVAESQCDPHGSLTPNPDADGKCRCKNFATGLTCDSCKPNTFSLASKNQFGCISCFCMGVSNRCTASHWYRSEIKVSFTNSIRDFSLIQSKNPDATTIVSGIRLDTSRREIIYNEFPNRGSNDVYYWQLPSIFLGDQVTSYGGSLKYTVRYVPSPGGQSSKNSAADVELISSNDINLLYYSRKSPEPNSVQSFEVPLLEQFWQRTDGTQADREHLLMALADIQAIRIKATYTTNTDETAISQVSLDNAEKYNTGKDRAVEVEECTCPAGYTGLSCEDCAAGYTRAGRGLYLGTCEPCNCNGHSSQCDPENGICENCADHTTGDNCEKCEADYIGDATRGGPYDCISDTHLVKPCNPAGTMQDSYLVGRCECKLNVEGAECNRCRPGTFGLSSDNINGCNQCYCSGVTDQCHESSLFIQQIPMWVYDTRHGFTLTDTSRLDVIDDGFEINVAQNEIGYRYTTFNRNRRLFWSLPAIFTGNKIKSYGGNLTLTQRFTASPNSKTLEDQDVTLLGNGITLFWTNPKKLTSDNTLTYSVPLRESEWRRLSTEGLRSASRTDLMTVLSNLESILVRASYSEGMITSSIGDISLDTAVENLTGKNRATQIEACRCPLGYTGTSCENCGRGYYRDINDRSVSILGSCNACPCNDHEESCDMSRNGIIKCRCLSGYTGQYCQELVDYPPPPPSPPPTLQPPRIIVSIQEKQLQIVETGNTVRYRCSGRSLDNTPIRIHWDKEGGRLPDRSMDDKQGLLIIRDVRVSDSGVYICQVTDDIQVVIDKVTLTVGGSNPVEPKAVIRPIYQQVKEGDSVNFVCEAEGNPKPELEWIRIGGTVNPSATFINGIWSIPSVTKDDEAEYKCIAKNSVGSNEQTTILYVDNNPDKEQPPIVQTSGPTITPSQWIGSSGDTVRLICSRLNYHKHVEWIRSGSLPLPHSASQHDGVLTIPNPNENDSGTYICIATSNQNTETSSNAQITIHPRRNPPMINVEPEKQIVQQGKIAEIKCLVNDRDPNVEVKWFKYGEQVLGSRAQQHGTILKIIDIQISDRGRYICRANNSAGTFEASAMIDVERREIPVLELYPKNTQTVILDGSADLQCRVVAGYPTPELHWSRKDGRQFGSNIQQLPGGLLRLIHISLNDGGSYQCTAVNDAGTTTAFAHIEVQSMPVITITPKSGILPVKLRNKILLSCNAVGNPPPNVIWSKYTNGYPPSINPLVRSQLSTAIYEISSMSIDDEGSYTCQATNAAGVSEERVQLRIEDNEGYDDEVNSIDDPEACRGDQPCNITPTYHPDNQILIPTKQGLIIPNEYLKIPIGGKVEMQCRVVAPQRINLDWIRQDQRSLPYGSTINNGILTINDVNKEAAGEYICRGFDDNNNELFRQNAHLEIISPPRIILHPNRQTVAPGDSPTIICSVTGDQPIKIQWDSIGRSLPSSVIDDNGLLKFNSITFNDAGKYICKATNDVGTAEAVAEVIVNENYNSAGVKAIERDVKTLAGNSVRLRCDTRESVSIQWTREGLPLPTNSKIVDNHLELLKVRPEDSGRYFCQIRNSQGTGSSDYINFQVSLVNSLADCMPIYPSIQCANNGLYLCRSQDCVSLDFVCDGYAHCSDGTDERFCRITRYRQYLQRRRAPTGPVIRIEPSSTIVNIGDTFNLRCEFTSRNPSAPRYRWYKADGSLPASVQVYEDRLKIASVQMSDSGVYNCRVDTQEGIFDKDYNLIVQGGEHENDEPAIEMKSVAYGSPVDLTCRANLRGPVTYQWNKTDGDLPLSTTSENKLTIMRANELAAGTYICSATNGITNTEVPVILVVTGIVPNFSQAPRSYISLPPLPDSYLKFNIEVSFKPENHNGIIFYNAERSDGLGDFIILSLINGHPEFKYDLGSGTATIHSDRPVTLGEWHTIKLNRNRKEGIMMVDGEGSYKSESTGRKQGLDLKEPLYIGNIPDYVIMNQNIQIGRIGFVGCISKLELNDRIIELTGSSTSSVGVTTCETCAENPCNNSGVCQEATTKSGYRCLCRVGYSGQHCDSTGKSCLPGICGRGRCISTETGFDCLCPHGTQGQRCEENVDIKNPAFRNEHAYLAYQTPKAMRRPYSADKYKSKRSHARSYLEQLKNSRSSHHHDNKI